MENRKWIFIFLTIAAILLLSVSTVMASNPINTTTNTEDTTPQIETDNTQNQVNNVITANNTNQISQTTSDKATTAQQVNTIKTTTKTSSDNNINNSNSQNDQIQTNTQNTTTNTANTQITDTNKKQQESDPQSITPTQTVTKKVTEKQNTTQIQIPNTQIVKTSLKTTKQATSKDASNYEELVAAVADAKASSDNSYTITLTGKITITATKTISWSGATGTLRNLTINGNGNTIDGQGTYGFIAVGNGYTLNLVNVTIQNTKKTLAYDGAVVNNAGNLTIANSTIINNTAYAGGVIWSNGNVTIINTTLYNNSASSDGGVIYNDNTGNVVIENTTMYNNTAHTSGAIISYGNLTINNSEFYSNSASKSIAGAIYVNKNAIINNSHLYNNTAITYGGTIYVNSGNLNITNSLIENSTAIDGTSRTQGGAIYTGGDVNIINTTICNSKAYTDGGAIYNAKAGILNINDSIIYNNTARTSGAICSTGNITVNNGTFYLNDASNSIGGAIYTSQNATIINSHLYNNTAKTSGGSIYIASGNSTICNTTLENSSAVTDGGAIYNDATLIINNVTFCGNNATENAGGAIYNNDTMKITNSSKFFNNTCASDGGAICSPGILNVNDTEFYNNKIIGELIGRFGGAICTNGTTVIGNSTFHDNEAVKIDTSDAGALNAGSNAKINITNTTFYNNVAGGNSGAIKNSGNMILINVTVYNNTAKSGMYGHGGAINNQGAGNLTIDNSTLYNNTSRRDGGAIYNEANMNITNTELFNNTITGTYTGGAIYNVANGVLKLNNVTAYNNKAELGSAISNHADLSINNSNIYNNSAIVSGTIYTTGNLTVGNTSFTNNTVTTKGGAIYSVSGANVTLGNNTFTNIKAGNETLNLPDTNIIFDTANPDSFTNCTIGFNENTISPTTSTEYIGNNVTETAKFTLIYPNYYDENILTNSKYTVYVNNIENKTITKNEYNVTSDTVGTVTTYVIPTIANTASKTATITFNTRDTNIVIDTPITGLATKTTTITASITDYNNLPITTGNVTFYVNGQSIGTIELSNSNLAKINYNFPTSGDYTIKAVYNDTNNEYTNNTSSEVTAQITTIPTNINVDVNPGTTTTNTTIKVNVTDNSGNIIKTGTVTVYDNGNVIGTVDVTNGEIKLNKILNQSGNHNITAAYKDNTGVYASSNTSVFIDISKTGVDVSVPSVNGTIGNVTLNATIIDVNGNNVADGVVLFYVNGSYVGLANVTNGIASINTTLDNIGTFNITAVYNGTSVYDNQTGNGTIVVNNKLNTTIKVNPVFSMVGNITQLQANITDENGNPVNGGRVVFKINGQVLRDANGNVIYVNVTDGKALLNYTCPVSWAKANVTISAVYSGTDNKYNSSRSTNAKVTVIKRTAIINLIVTRNPVKAEDTTQFLAVVHDANGTILNSGVVVFKFQGHTIKDVNNNTVLVNVTNGCAILNYTIFDGISAHDYNITAVYSNPAYYRAENKTSITAEKTNTIITVDPVTGISGQNTTITGTIKDIHGNIVQGTNRISIKLNGKTILSNVTVTNGIINENITIPSGLKQNTYNITVVTGTRLAYNSSSGTGILINNKTNLKTVKQKA